MYKRIILTVVSNLALFVIGASAGIIIAVQWAVHNWVPARAEQLSPGCGTLVGTLALIAVAVLLFGLVGCVVGGIIGIVLYQILRIVVSSVKKRNRHQRKTITSA